jgi:hypothetical protein
LAKFVGRKTHLKLQALLYNQVKQLYIKYAHTYCFLRKTAFKRSTDIGNYMVGASAQSFFQVAKGRR